MMRFERQIEWYLQNTLSVGELTEVLSQYPKDMKVITTWESTMHCLSKSNIYESHQGYLLLDADDNFYKDDLAKHLEEKISRNHNPKCCGRSMEASFGEIDGYFCTNCTNWEKR